MDRTYLRNRAYPQAVPQTTEQYHCARIAAFRRWLDDERKKRDKCDAEIARIMGELNEQYQEAAADGVSLRDG